MSARVKEPRLVGIKVGASLLAPKPTDGIIGSSALDGVDVLGVVGLGGNEELEEVEAGGGTGAGSNRRHGSIGAKKPFGGFFFFGAILFLIAMATENLDLCFL